MKSFTRLLAIETLGGRCAVCQIEDTRVLQIDHIAGNAREDRQRKRVGGKLYRFIINHPVQAKREYQVLCANHNWIKRYMHKEHAHVEGRSDELNEVPEWLW